MHRKEKKAARKAAKKPGEPVEAPVLNFGI